MVPQVIRRQAVDFYTIELSCLADGTLFVAMTATGVDEQEPQLLTQEITDERSVFFREASALSSGDNRWALTKSANLEITPALGRRAYCPR